MILGRVDTNQFVLQVVAAMCSKVPCISSAIVKATDSGMSSKICLSYTCSHITVLLSVCFVEFLFYFLAMEFCIL